MTPAHAAGHVLMKVGINLLLWTSHPSARQHRAILEQIKKWGYDGVELPISNLANDEGPALADLLDGLGLERTTILSFSAGMADPSSSDLALRKSALERLQRGIDLTAEMGSSLMAGPVFQGLGSLSGVVSTRAMWENSVEVIRAAGEYAADRRIRLALEPLNRFEMSLVNTIAQGAAFCRDVGQSNVGLLADTHHANIEEEDAAAAWRREIEHIFHVHISENHRGIPGRGHAIPEEVFEALSAGGYNGWLVIEAFTQKVPDLVARLHIWRAFFESEEDVATQGLTFIREHWERASASRSGQKNRDEPGP